MVGGGVGSFHDRYRSKCHELQVEPHPRIVDETGSKLSVSHSVLGEKQALAIAFALATDTTFQELELMDTYVGDTGCCVICEALQDNRSVHSVKLRGNNLRSVGAHAIACVLKLSTALTALSLEWNNIGCVDEGLNVITLALHSNHTLRFCDLRNNKIGPDGARAIAHMLCVNTTLQNLDLRWNKIGGFGGRVLCDALTSNESLHQLQLTGNEVEHAVLQQIEGKLVANRKRQITTREHQWTDQQVQLRQQREQADLRHMELQKQVDEEIHIQQEQRIKHEFETHLEEMKSKYEQQSREIINSQRTQVSSLQEQLVQQIQQVEQQQTIISDLERQIQSLKSERDDLLTKQNTVNMDKDKIHNEKNLLLAKLQQLEGQLESIKQRQTGDSSEYLHQIGTLESKVAEKEKEIVTLKAHIQEQEHLVHTKDQLIATKDHQLKAKDAANQEQCNIMQQEHAQTLLSEQMKHKAQIDKYLDKEIKLNNAIHELEMQITFKNEEINNMKRSTERHAQLLSEESSWRQERISEVQQLKLELQEAKHQLSTATTENTRLSNLLGEVEGQLKTLRTEKHQVDVHYQAMRDDHDKLVFEHRFTKDSLEKTEQQLENEVSSNDDLRHQLKSIKRESEREKTNMRNQYDKEMDMLSQKTETMVKDLQDALNSKEMEVTTLKEDKSMATQRHNKQVENYEEQVRQLQQDISEHKIEKQRLDNSIREHKLDISTLKSHMHTLEQSKHSDHQQILMLKQQKDSAVEELQAQHMEAQAEKNLEIKVLTSKCNQLQMEAAALREKNASAVENSKKQMDNLQARLLDTIKNAVNIG